MRINPYAGSGDVGYWVDADYEGRGLVSRSARALISSVFEEHGLARVELRTSVDNRRSRAVAERLGFGFEGTLPGGLRFTHRSDDVALYSVTAERWSALATAATQHGR
jgi:ribosomal-protein-serine acetyltransferase